MPDNEKKECRQERGLTRRSFLKTSAFVVGTAAVASGFGCSTAPTTTTVAEGDEKVVWGRCYHGGCFSCRYNVTVRDGVAVRITPDPTEPYGRRPCLRGYSQLQRLYAPDRIRYPMKRAGERGEDKWEQITWDEAVTTITDKWKELVGLYGTYCLAFYGGSAGARYGSISMSKLGMVLSATTFDMSADWALYHGLHNVYGAFDYSTMGTPSNDPTEDDLINAKTIFLWGHNLSEAYIQRWRYVMEAQENGTKLITIDPTATTTALRSDEWYRIRPGSDTALMLSMTQVAIEEKLHDVTYLKTLTVAPFLVKDSDGTFLRMSDLGVAPTQGPADPMTGQVTMVDPQVVWDEATATAVAYTEAVDPPITGSREVNGIKVKTAFDLLVTHLKAYTPEKVSEYTDLSADDIRKLARIAASGPVSHMFGLGWQAYHNGFQIGSALATLVAVTGQTSKPGAGIVAAAWEAPMNAMWLFPTFTFSNSISWLDAVDVIETSTFAGQPYSPIKALMVSGGGVVGSIVDMNKILSGVIDKMELIVVADVAFSDTARYADIILPAHLPMEAEDCNIALVTRDMQYAPQVVEPMWEVKTVAETACLLGSAMGFKEHFSYTHEDSLRALLDTPALSSVGITLDTLRKNGDMRMMPPSLAGAQGSFPTPSGKVEFYVENPAPRKEIGHKIDVAKNRLAHFYPPLEVWPEAEAAKKFPFQLISFRARNRWHTAGFNVPWLNELEKEQVVHMNNEDAAVLEISDGDYVEVFNDRGRAVAKVALNAGMRPGMLSYIKGLQSKQYKEGHFATLTHQEYDPLATNQSFFDCCVDVRKWKE